MEQNNNNQQQRHFRGKNGEMTGLNKVGPRETDQNSRDAYPHHGKEGMGRRAVNGNRDAQSHNSPPLDKLDKKDEPTLQGQRADHDNTSVVSNDGFSVEARVKESRFNTFLKRVNKNAVVSESKIIHRSGIDIPLLMIFILLIAYGVIMVFTASYAYAYNKTGNSYDFIKSQLIFIALGAVLVAFIIFFYDIMMNKKLVPWAVSGYYLLMLAMLVLVLIIGRSDGEAKRWIYIGSVSIQPSEFMKGALIMMMALYYSVYNKVIKESKGIRSFMMGTVMPMLIFIAPVVFLIYLENHASGMIITFLIGVMMIVFGEKRHIFIGTCAVIGITAVTAAIIYLINLDPNEATGIGKSIIESYQWRRIEIWLRPENFSLKDDLWQTAQGMYAIGSGGFMGVGFGQSRQKHMFVSQPQNDFIYTIICEELGFVGAVAVIILFCALVWRGYVVGKRIPDRFSRYTVWGLTMSIAMQAFLNIAVVTNLIPNTGISLPFFSYGGSSIISLMIEVGLILAISRYANKQA